LFLGHDACGSRRLDALKVGLNSAHCFPDADDDLLTHVGKRDFRILGLQLALVVRADGRAVAERITEDEPRSIVVEIAAEVFCKRLAVIAAESGQPHRALERQSRQQLVAGELLIEFARLNILFGLGDFRALFDRDVDGLLEAEGL